VALPGRYDASGVEAEFEPGSKRRVLRNLLGIRSVREMERAESDALLEAQEKMIDRFTLNHRFTAADIRELHRLWLGDVYSWAGEYRGVNITKGDFYFAAAMQVPRLMLELERKQLSTYTPCEKLDASELAKALSVVHAELILIHPFRDGNGRCARLLAMLMAFQAGLPPLDFGGLRGQARRSYVAAVHAALGADYLPMREIFEGIVRRTLFSHARGGRTL
jgi:cell filamentation protein